MEVKKATLIIDGKEIEVEITQEQIDKLCPKKKTGYERVENDRIYWTVIGTNEIFHHILLRVRKQKKNRE